ncbi:MAG TPA: CRTAC1 family protein, partial [Longimicrobiales bacterium]|nr:CRTAC1 family protein [Longimicrobiales bacterium]
MRVSHVLSLVVAISIIQPQFEPVQPELFSARNALTNAWADFDADGDLDLFVGFNGAGNRLYRNDNGRFSDVAGEAGVADARATRAAAWGDFDRDGDADLLVGFAPGAASVLKLYLNDHGRFTDHTAPAGLSVDSGAVRQPSWVDYDDDGDLDLFVALRDRPNLLFQNNAGRFNDIAKSVGLDDPRRSVGAVWFDYDRDGDLDLYVANMDGDANGLFRSQLGRFTDVAMAAGAAWGGRAPGEPTNGTVRPCVADLDGDGLLDLFLANYGRNGLLLNRGDGTFEDVSEKWGVAVDARFDTCAPADFDHDGRIDLYVNGTITSGVSYPDYLYHNTGLKLEEVTPTNVRMLQASHGAQWADYDADGDLDLALAGTAPGATHSLLRNQLTASGTARSLQVLVLDDRGRSTRAGTEVRVYGARARLIGTRIVDTGSGYNSQNDAPLHFGMGSAELV